MQRSPDRIQPELRRELLKRARQYMSPHAYGNSIGIYEAAEAKDFAGSPNDEQTAAWISSNADFLRDLGFADIKKRGRSTAVTLGPGAKGDAETDPQRARVEWEDHGWKQEVERWYDVRRFKDIFTWTALALEAETDGDKDNELKLKEATEAKRTTNLSLGTKLNEKGDVVHIAEKLAEAKTLKEYSLAAANVSARAEVKLDAKATQAAAGEDDIQRAKNSLNERANILLSPHMKIVYLSHLIPFLDAIVRNYFESATVSDGSIRTIFLKAKNTLDKAITEVEGLIRRHSTIHEFNSNIEKVSKALVQLVQGNTYEAFVEILDDEDEIEDAEPFFMEQRKDVKTIQSKVREINASIAKIVDGVREDIQNATVIPTTTPAATPMRRPRPTVPAKPAGGDVERQTSTARPATAESPLPPERTKELEKNGGCLPIWLQKLLGMG